MITENDVLLAKKIAENAHEGQFRNDGVTPYIIHVYGVADSLDTNLDKAIGYLHDVIEDCEGYDADMLRALGVKEEIITGVLAMTHPKGEPNFDYLDRIIAAGIAHIKMADIIYNVTDEPTASMKAKYRKNMYYLMKAINAKN